MWRGGGRAVRRSNAKTARTVSTQAWQAASTAATVRQANTSRTQAGLRASSAMQGGTRHQKLPSRRRLASTAAWAPTSRAKGNRSARAALLARSAIMRTMRPPRALNASPALQAAPSRLRAHGARMVAARTPSRGVAQRGARPAWQASSHQTRRSLVAAVQLAATLLAQAARRAIHASQARSRTPAP